MNDTRLSRQRRKGSVFGLFAVLLPVLGLLTAFALNAAYMQLTRTELIVATDCASQAAGRAFSEYQDVDMARTAAQATAGMNTVAGVPLQLNTADGGNLFEFGRTNNSGGNYTRFTFQPINTADVRSGAQKASAVRVTGSRGGAGSPLGPVSMIFPAFIGQTSFTTSSRAVSMQVDRDISLVIDRSGSMADYTWNWPSGKSPYYTSTKNAGVAAGILTYRWGNYYYASGQNQTSYWTWAWQTHYNLGPAPTSPWSQLVTAVDTFLDVLVDTPQEEKVALASYATTGSLNAHLTTNYETIRTALDNLSPNGNTAIGLGMQQGITALLHANARPYAAKTMVVMTDGIHNTGIDPVTVATNLVAQYPLTIHTVTFGASADIPRMQSVATIGGGKHYHAANGEELIDVFEEIANNVATVLTE